MFKLQGLVEQIEKFNVWVDKLMIIDYVEERDIREDNADCIKWVKSLLRTLALLVMMHGVP
jgi:hypothetical protein